MKNKIVTNKIMKNKKLILIVCLIIIILVSIITCIYIFANREEAETSSGLIDGIGIAKNKDILKDTKVEELQITNVSLFVREGITSYSALVTNNTDKNIDINKLYVIFHENGEERKILALSNIQIKPTEEQYISITSEKDLSNTEKIEYVIEK